MSRKDPRRTLLVPLNAEALSYLRTNAQNRSLGDTLRRIVQHALRNGAHRTDVGQARAVRRLPVQLPKATRAQVDHLASQSGQPAALVVAQLLAARQRADDPPTEG